MARDATIDLGLATAQGRTLPSRSRPRGRRGAILLSLVMTSLLILPASAQTPAGGSGRVLSDAPAAGRAVTTEAAPSKTSVEEATVLRVLAEQATALRTEILTNATSDPQAAARFVRESRQAAARGDWETAVSRLRAALRTGYTDPGRWLTLADLYQKAEGPEPHAYLAAYLHASESLAAGARAEGLLRTADLLLAADRDDTALLLYRRANTTLPSPRAANAIAALTGGGLAVRRTQVEADRDLARLCLELTGAPALSAQNPLRDYVTVDPPVDVGLSVTGKRLCLDGLPHGREVTVTLRPGLPTQAGAPLATELSVTQAIPNRAPRAAFAGDAYILPARGVREVSLRTVNLSQVWLTLSRVNERGLAFVLRDPSLRTSVSESDVETLAEEAGERVWQGRLDIEGQPNHEVATAISMDRLLPHPQPGLYLLTAEDRLGEATPWGQRPFQWLLITDIGVQTATGQDGLSVFVRSLSTGKPLTGATLTLVARNNEELGEATTDRNGMARFQPGQLSGTGGRTASWVMIHGPEGDFAYLDLAGPAFDLSDRGVSGRAVPGPLDAFLYTDRGIYRPGETVHLTTLLRDESARALPGLPLTLKVMRPDGVQVDTRVIAENALGAATLDLPLLSDARTGAWEVTAHVDPDTPAVGRVRFQVEDFAPLTMSLALTPDAPVIDQTTETPAPVTVGVQADYLYGAPAAQQPVSAAVTLDVDPEPFPAYAAYHFGLAQETLEPRRLALADTRTDASGAAQVTVAFDEPLPDTSHPLRALVRAEVVDAGGRGAARTVILPVRTQPVSLGIRPAFTGGTLDEGREAGFAVVALSPNGQPLADRAVDWILYEEVSHFTWFESDGTWSYRRTVSDEPRASGRITTGTDGVAQITAQPQVGAYRLEVSDASGSLAASSVRFRTGWWATAADERDTPDTLKVVREGERSYTPGDRARVRLEAPFAGEALVAVVSDRVLDVLSVSLPRDGLTVELPVTEAWGVGAYVVATAFRPGNGAGPQGPGRAMGVSWLPVDPGNRLLNVALEVPEKVQPRTTLEVPVSVSGAQGPVHLTVAAVDEGILQLTDFTSPDPVTHFLGKRALGLDFRDAYGRLLRAPDARPGRLREGGDQGRAFAGLPETSVRTVALFSGMVNTDAKGKATVRLDLPDFNGRLRLMAVAFSAEAVGKAEASVVVRDPVVALSSLPRFLAPGDTAALGVTLDNQDGPEGAWTVAVKAEGAVGTEPAETAQSVPLARHARGSARFILKGLRPGQGQITLTLTGPDGQSRASTWTLGVRPAAPRVTAVHALDLAPRGQAELGVALLDGLDPATTKVSLDLASVPNLAPRAHATALAAYPYGCLEQTVSRAQVALAVLDGTVTLEATDASKGTSKEGGKDGSKEGGKDGSKEAARDALARDIARLIALQRADGGFALWSSSGPLEPWLSAYAVDFLLRARETGVAVPAFALERGLAFLDSLAAGSDLADIELPTAAYAQWVLARAGAGDLGALRHFHDTYGPRLPTLLARAQTAAALSLLGDATRASAVLAPTGLPGIQKASTAAAPPLPEVLDPTDGDPVQWNYGSVIRDQAGALALGLEAGLPGFDPLAAADALALAAHALPSPSTQERAWLLRAAQALGKRQGTVAASLDGTPVGAERAQVSVPLSAAALAKSATLVNDSNRPLRVAAVIDGQPLAPPPASSTGLEITRRYMTLEGRAASLSDLRQNDLLVAVVEGKVQDPRTLDPRGQALLVVDLLPAGVTLENPAVGQGQDSTGLEWLPELTPVDHAERRDDRFVAALTVRPDTPTFTLAYVVRAQTPGTYTLPGVAAEVMARPGLRGNQAAGKITVSAR
ncbi:alpha-2-macroglobulin family protein [Pararhodospirillum photometricum]|uniref:Alpha-2-macroglobulin-like protein n=1 Tax=Pararhodospirillum photometricum DSM 122 TaxID=1150469 RepID=H6SPI1_PARPM|nr:alpha-2-macroglobulin [Pararhodospirillum photometricum]CCG09506.1 Alpha-2-macroglobulin-like protein [Pararhodospirillum photometricum DSM 122]